MIGKIIGALAGAQAAKHTRKLGGAGGAILGMVAVPIVTRMRLRTMLVLGVGGYVVKKLMDSKEAPEDIPPMDS